MIAGYFSFGAIAERLARRKIQPMTVAAAGMLGFIIIQCILVLQPQSLTLLIWLLFGFLGTSCILPYAVLSQNFPKQLSGRANTGLNLLVFSAAFAAQWAIGLVINLWPQTTSGGYNAIGYSVGFGLVIIFQMTAAIWYFISLRSKNNSKA